MTTVWAGPISFPSMESGGEFPLDDYLAIIERTPDIDLEIGLFFPSGQTNNKRLLNTHRLNLALFLGEISPQMTCFGFSFESFSDLIKNGDDTAVREISVSLLRAISERKNDQGIHSISNKIVISDSLIITTISLLTEAMAHFSIVPPYSFVILLRVFSNLDRGQPLQALRKRKKTVRAIDLLGNDPDMSIRQAAKIMGVSPNTVSVLISNSSLKELIPFMHNEKSEYQRWVKALELVTKAHTSQ